MKTIAQRFMDFQEQVMSPDAPPIQRTEMRLAFFAGAKSMLDAGIELADLSDYAAVLVLEAFHCECHAFGKAYGHREN